MLKTVLLFLMIITTTVRLADIVYLLASGSSNLPVAVTVTACLLIAYALILMAKKLMGGNITLRQFIAYYSVHAAVTLFNLLFTSAASPLPVSWTEALALGTFFDILVDLCAVYFSYKQIRSHYLAVAPEQTRR